MNAAKLTADPSPPVLLRGTRRGLEIIIDSEAEGGGDAGSISRALEERLAEAPKFFAGSDVTVAVSGALPSGSLSALDTLTARFGLRIAEVRPTVHQAEVTPEQSDAVPEPIDYTASEPAAAVAHSSKAQQLTGSAAGYTSCSAHQTGTETAPSASSPTVATGSSPTAAQDVVNDAPKLCVGPVRSGVVLDAPGHLVIVGDVNPGAEIRAAGCIVVLGALRGTAHAGYGQKAGFILALKLQPQQLRIADRIARAGDGDTPPESAEIAYVKNNRIVVDAYNGRLPSGAIAAQG